MQLTIVLVGEFAKALAILCIEGFTTFGERDVNFTWG